MARTSKKKAQGIGPGVIIAALAGVVLVSCLLCAGGGAVVFFLRNNANNADRNVANNRLPRENPPPNLPIRKFTRVTYRVLGNPTPDLQSGRIRKALESLPNVEAGSVETTATEIRFRIAQGATLERMVDTITMELGYQITLTSTAPWP